VPDDPGFARELDLRDYLQVLRRRRGTIALTVVIIVGLSLAYSLRQTPTYEATSQVLVDLPGADGAGSTAQGTEIVLIQAPAMRAAVTKALGHSPDVSVGPIPSTDLFAFTARSTSARRAARDANVYARVYIDQHREKTTAAGLRLQRKIGELDGRIAVLDSEVAVASPADRAAVYTQQAGERGQLSRDRTAAAERLESLVPASNAAATSIVAKAAVPTSPVKPTTRRNVLVAFVVGLVLGIMAAFVREHFDDAVRTRDDVERVSGVPVVGMIPSAKEKSKVRKTSELVASAPSSSPTAEAYRTLRTSLQFVNVSRPMRMLQVTSPSAAGGKTTTVANLAVTAARSRSRVLVVCCDLRRPRVHELFGLTNDVGLTSVLLGEVSLEDAVQSVADEPNLMVLASGPTPPNPAEMLALPRTAEILRSARAKCDLLIIDSPPVLPVTDALIVSRLVDATLIVATVGSTRKRELQRTVELLRQVDAPLVGAVLNYPRSRSGDGYGSGYGYGPETGRRHARNSAGSPNDFARRRGRGASPAPPTDRVLAHRVPAGHRSGRGPWVAPAGFAGDATRRIAGGTASSTSNIGSTCERSRARRPKFPKLENAKMNAKTNARLYAT
jgi:polysaccharide biosynthesis transport protein